MLNGLVTTLLWFGALGCGLMAGVYFAFSTFIMASLAKIETPSGIAAMQSINDVILGSAFMPLFFGTSLAAAGAVVLYFVDPGRAGASWMLIAGIVYVVGMFLCTAIFNVPLNEKLKAVDPGSTAGAEMWTQYLREWTHWNHVRTLASAVAGALFFLALPGQ